MSQGQGTLGLRGLRGMGRDIQTGRLLGRLPALRGSALIPYRLNHSTRCRVKEVGVARAGWPPLPQT